MYVPQSRIRLLNRAPIHPARRFVLYWMTAYRRPGWNFSLDRAVQWAERLGAPLVVLEALRCDYPWASDRTHRFVMDGMAANLEAFERAGVCYYPYLEPSPGAGKGLLAALAEHACVVVTDDFPAFIIPNAAEAAARTASVRLETVDSNGLTPVRLTGRSFLAASSFRRFSQANLPEQLAILPSPDPLARGRFPRSVTLPETVTSTWPGIPGGLLSDSKVLAHLPLDHRVPPAKLKGGTGAARAALDRFLSGSLPHYAERNEPSARGTSGLSPYLHFGHISAHEVFTRVASAEGWSPARLSPATDGRRSGWWGMSVSAEAFLDQIITWRELAFNTCVTNPAFESYSSLPEWVRKSLKLHEDDPRPVTYSLEQLEASDTHDRVWNAAQNQLLREGIMHNYLRMLWGKKIIEWSPDPREALHRMIEINNRFALDGRDPNSYAGISWCLGRYDRPWFPERPIFGNVRYMSSERAAQKLDLAAYLDEYAPAGSAVAVSA